MKKLLTTIKSDNDNGIKYLRLALRNALFLVTKTKEDVSLSSIPFQLIKEVLTEDWHVVTKVHDTVLYENKTMQLRLSFNPFAHNNVCIYHQNMDET